MSRQVVDFSNPQWEFLAVLDAFGDPVPIDMVSTLVPLSPSALLSLIERTKDDGWLIKTDALDVGLIEDLPPYAKEKIRQINTESRHAAILNQLQDHGFQSALSPKALANIMNKSGQSYEAALLEKDLAVSAIENRQHPEAEEHIEKILHILHDHLGEQRYDELFITSVLGLSKVRSRMDKDPAECYELLEQARKTAKNLGDQRNHALCSLHIGWHFIYHNELLRGLSEMSPAIETVRALGDTDIRTQSCEFFGINYFFQGLYREAAGYFEKALQAEAAGHYAYFSKWLPMFMAYSSIIIGQIERATGVLDCAVRRAEMIPDEKLATFHRASLGIMLIQWKETQKALPHLQTSLNDAKNLNDPWTLGEALMGMALYHYSEGRILKAHEFAVQCMTNVVNIVPWGQHPIWPQTIELLFAFRNMGCDVIPNYDYEKERERFRNGPNIHLHGLSCYMQAEEALQHNENPALIRSLLEDGLADFNLSGDLINRAKCQVTLARLSYQEGDLKGAKNFALSAWEVLSGYGHKTFPQEIFPDSLKPLLGISSLSDNKIKQDDLLEKFIRLMDGFLPSTDEEILLSRLITASSRFFESERGGLFIIDGGHPILYAGYNLTKHDVASSRFRYKLDQIMKAYKNGQPLVVHPGQTSKDNPAGNVSAILCLPFEYREKVNGVLYYDNAYIDKSFGALDRALLMKISRHLGTYAARVRDYFRLMEKRAVSCAEDLRKVTLPDDQELKYQSPIMKNLLLRAKQAAASEASVLVLGETGVGKELLARQIHAMSARNKGPFIVVDLTSIPETLVESELFGHEKGSFTGADRQKNGRMEMAHNGTLFIDEVGDIPKSVQTKILRALQEKTFSRVGGTRTLTSDFRLVAATNRNLAYEVELGNFREDLYYRINVVPLILPPLRERGKEVIYLAQHFLDFYARKYKRQSLSFSSEDKGILISYTWPGNVRELKNVIERAVIMSSADRPELILPMESKAHDNDVFADKPSLEEVQRRYIRYILDQTGGRISGSDGAAALLGMKRTSLYTRMKKLGMK